MRAPSAGIEPVSSSTAPASEVVKASTRGTIA